MPIFPSQRKVTGYDPITHNVTVDTGKCLVCGQGGTVILPKSAWEAYADGRGMFIQNAWPQGSVGEREQLINGTHPACFEQIFPPEEEEEDTQNTNYANGDTE